ncbi:MAG: hypothetical protein JO336_11345 [Acidobacteriia bacterium]|nr:hypothetical protein [Terriglobia bacterium]MBV8905381.1 hypothetical protein [Terriglobia bacterium]
MREILRVAAALLACAWLSDAQWFNQRDSTIPRTKDGKPNLSAPAPKLNGKPDLSGVWEVERTPSTEYARVLGPGFEKLQVDSQDVTKYMINLFWGLRPEDQPVRPEAAAIVRQRANLSPPTAQCLPGGVPMSTLLLSFKLIQAPREIVMLSGIGDPARQIYMDGRKLPKSPDPAWMGYSVGKWEGDTLAVETTGFDERSFLDAFGHPRSESMHITERFRRRDFGHMDLEMTFDDPKYYTRPFTIRTSLNLLPDTDVLEYVCTEDEKDRAHLGK